jgi:hypothetical protein
MTPKRLICLAAGLALFAAGAIAAVTAEAAAPQPGLTAATVAPPATPAGASPSLPPPRVADCVNFALLDDACTKRWYACRRGGGGTAAASCFDAWEDCCTLRGQGARSRLGSAEPVTTNR